MAKLPHFGINNTSYGLSYALQESNCGEFTTQNNQFYLTTLFDNAWQGIETITDFSQTLTPLINENTAYTTIHITQTPVPAAV